MNKLLRFSALLFCLAFAYTLLTGSSAGRATAVNQGNTGAPNETTTCGSCHSGGGFGTITPNIQVFQQGTTTPITSYVPGTTYDVSVTVQHSAGSPGGYGFQMTCLKVTGNAPLSGYSNLGSNVKQKTITAGTFAGRTYVEQNGVLNNNVFTMRWTAPAAGSGSVKFYTAANAVNNNGNDNGDNSGTSSLTLTESVSAALSVTGNVTNVSCNGGNNGAINITATGGTPPYTYNWGSGITTEDRNNLTAGSYTVIITDNTGSTTTSSYTVTQPAVLNANSSATTISCNGGNSTVTVTANGGTAPYSGVGTFTVIAGTYQYNVTDANGCIATTSVTVNQPTQLTAASSSTAILCNGGQSTVTVTGQGGTSPYTGTGTFTVTAGMYQYTVTDANGCQAITSIGVSQPQTLSASVGNVTPAVNNQNGAIQINVSGGTSPYTYSWSNGQTTQNVSQLASGVYFVWITDANGCTTQLTEIMVSNNVGIEAMNPLFAQIYPNPVTDKLILQLQTAISSPITLSIYDVQGKRHLSQVVYSPNADKYELSVKELPKGTYFLSVQYQDKIYQQSFVK